MAKIKDLTGQKFGKLTAIEPTDKRTIGGSVMWECICDCGNTCYASSSELSSGKTRSCGCIPRGYPKGKYLTDLSGQRFGKLTAIEPTDKRVDRSVVWRCKCDCGNVCYVLARNLRRGSTKSCGCGRKVDISGQKFGRLTAIEPTDQRKGSYVVWKCECDCGNICYASANDLKFGKVKSCGCLKKGVEI